jgi:hypothetical protein
MDTQSLCFSCAMGISKDEHDCQRSIELTLEFTEFSKKVDESIDHWLKTGEIKEY